MEVVGAPKQRVTEIEMPKRVLVVEDDRTIRFMLERTFSKTGEILIAENGAQGLEKLLQHEPDFVVTDLMLPIMDGRTMITRARRTFIGACVPILVLTASHEEDVLLDCFRQGADDFMVKPFSVPELRTRVSSIYLRQKVARDMNPLTRLPGNLVIKREIEARLESGGRFAVCYIDLDHFKALNDSRGFDVGDEAIALVAQILRSYATEHGHDEMFVGHVGGDDFVVMLPPDQVADFAHEVHERFALGVRHFYSSEEILRGTVVIQNRRGDLEDVPLLSMSIGVLISEAGGLDDLRKIAAVSAEVKKMAKKIPGNSLFVDRRTYFARDNRLCVGAT